MKCNESARDASVVIEWHVEDVGSIRPKWSLAKRKRFLEDNGKLLRDLSIELGWQVLCDLAWEWEREKKHGR